MKKTKKAVKKDLKVKPVKAVKPMGEVEFHLRNHTAFPVFVEQYGKKLLKVSKKHPEGKAKLKEWKGAFLDFVSGWDAAHMAVMSRPAAAAPALNAVPDDSDLSSSVALFTLAEALSEAAQDAGGAFPLDIKANKPREWFVMLRTMLKLPQLPPGIMDGIFVDPVTGPGETMAETAAAAEKPEPGNG